MCMMPQASSSADVPLEEVKALAGNPITNEDPRFKANKHKVRRMNLRINKPK